MSWLFHYQSHIIYIQLELSIISVFYLWSLTSACLVIRPTKIVAFCLRNYKRLAAHSIESFSSKRALACQPSSASIHVSLLFCSSHSHKCSLICASDISTTVSEPKNGCLALNLAKSSVISLNMIPLCQRVQSQSKVFSLAKRFSMWWHSRVSFEIAVILCIALRAALLLVHIPTASRLCGGLGGDSYDCHFSMNNGSVSS